MVVPHRYTILHFLSNSIKHTYKIIFLNYDDHIIPRYHKDRSKKLFLMQCDIL